MLLQFPTKFKRFLDRQFEWFKTSPKVSCKFLSEHSCHRKAKVIVRKRRSMLVSLCRISSRDPFVNSFELTIFELWWTRKSLPNDVNVSTICREAVRTFWSKWFFTVVSIEVNRNFHLENGPWFNCDWYIVDFLKVCCWCLLINLRFHCCYISMLINATLIVIK